jgi:hypothetical protein
MKEMTVKIPLNDKFDNKEKIKDLIYVMLEVCGDRFFSIDTVEIDGNKVFGMKNPVGFDKNF